MNNEPQLDVYQLTVATGPTAEALAAAPWATGGLTLIFLAFALCFISTALLGAQRRIPGRRLILSGLTVMMIYHLFRNTVAADAELRYGPVADALTLVSYGLGALIAAVGYARLVWHVRKERTSQS